MGAERCIDDAVHEQETGALQLSRRLERHARLVLGAQRAGPELPDAYVSCVM
jgi:hypothetical protein